MKDKGVPVPEIAKKLTLKTGKNVGQHPSVASAVCRALAEAEETGAAAGPEIIALRRPTRVELTGPGSSTTDAVGTVVEQTEDQANDVVAALLAHTRHQGEHA
ncbi:MULTISPECIES: hypothetical protein [Streptomyces]|uniref:hypothetical protein n=1 Tax=Streptomyces TaxID=1883 RepID=UPI0029A2F9CB|nr:hypothetical protein [Streptomyces sp. NY05-11A]MDX2677209.1 hypothetical protein [Streptomyces sp. NY05-11A]